MSPAARVAGGITVVGLGNVLLGDDALGPTVVQTLAAEYQLDPRVRLLELGTPGLDLVAHISGSDVLVVVDAVRSAGAPGEVRLYRKPQLLSRAAPPRVAGHDPTLRQALLLLELHGEAPSEVILVGVIPDAGRTGIGLSPEVRAAIPLAMAAVLAELERLGCQARRRSPSRPAALWWERPAAR